MIRGGILQPQSLPVPGPTLTINSPSRGLGPFHRLLAESSIHRWWEICRRRQNLSSTLCPPSLYQFVCASYQNCWIKSSILYVTQGTRSRTAASFQNRGSRTLENTFSRKSSSAPPRTWNYGKPRFLTLPPPWRITQKTCSLASLRSSQP